VKVFPSGWLKFFVLVKSEKQNCLLAANLNTDKGNGIEEAWPHEVEILYAKAVGFFREAFRYDPA